MTYTLEQKRKDAWSFVRLQIKANKLMRKKFESLDSKTHAIIPSKNEIQISGLIHLCALLDVRYTRVDWDGNENCKTDWDEVYFDFGGYRFFELVQKIYLRRGKDQIHERK